MKKALNVAILIVFALALLTCSMPKVYASDLSASTMMEEAKEFTERGQEVIDTQTVWEKLLPIGQILVAVGTVVLVICYMWMGIKYMIADPSGKADVKQRLIWLVISTVIIYGGIGIFTIIVNLMNSVTG